MLRLFKIQPDETADPIYFDSKRVAKHQRNQLSDELQRDLVIMRGPDHIRGESFNKANA